MGKAELSAPMMAAAMAGDRDAILALMSACNHDIKRYARRSCRTASDAEDAVQETLWILYRKIGGLREAAAFSGWLFSVVDRTCRRLAKAVRPQADIAALEDDRRLSTRPEAELRLDLAGGIQSLPAHYRDVLLLRDMEERTIDEIAGLLSATRETVKARLHRARTLMREYLKG